MNSMRGLSGLLEWVMKQRDAAVEYTSAQIKEIKQRAEAIGRDKAREEAEWQIGHRMIWMMRQSDDFLEDMQSLATKHSELVEKYENRHEGIFSGG